MSNYGYPTTLRHPRTLRQSGTELAASIERHRSNDHSGVAIVLICGVILALAIVGTWVGGVL
jgi:hypothetical protein